MKSIGQSDNIQSAVILSIILHCVLVVILIINSIQQPQQNNATNSRLTIDAMIIDPSMVGQQYTHQRQLNAQSIQQKNNKQVQQKAQELQKKQHDNQLKLAATQTKQDKKKKITKAKQKVSNTETAKQINDLDNLLNDLTNAKNASGLSGKYPGVVPANKIKKSEVSNDEINAYKAMISKAISDKFYDSSSYIGRTCDLHIKLAPDSMLILVTAIEGDTALCQAAVSASKLAVIPKPSNQQIYEVFKNITIRFSPQ